MASNRSFVNTVKAANKIIRKKLIVLNEFLLKSHSEYVITVLFLQSILFTGVLGISCFDVIKPLGLLKNTFPVKHIMA